MLGNTNANDIILPNLTNPATAAEILTGYQAIDGEGNMLTGTAQSGGNYEVTIVAGSGTGITQQLNGKPLFVLYYCVAARSQFSYYDFISKSGKSGYGDNRSSNSSASYDETTKIMNFTGIPNAYAVSGTYVILSEVD